MSKADPIEVIEFLSRFLTERRKTLINDVLQQRTRYLTVVLEDIFRAQNASAVLRTCECQGIQDVHIIENNHLYEVNPDVVKGAAKWLTLIKYPQCDIDNTPICFSDLRSNGYQIVGADPKGDLSMEKLAIDKPIALVFGTEFHGLSDSAKNGVDHLVAIPMYGFTESYNLSVSAAICLESITSRLRQSSIDWALSKNEINELKLEWYKGQVRDADNLILRHFDKT